MEKRKEEKMSQFTLEAQDILGGKGLETHSLNTRILSLEVWVAEDNPNKDLVTKKN